MFYKLPHVFVPKEQSVQHNTNMKLSELNRITVSVKLKIKGPVHPTVKITYCSSYLYLLILIVVVQGCAQTFLGAAAQGKKK